MYYRAEQIHYFVMTPTRKCLVDAGVLKQDLPAPALTVRLPRGGGRRSLIWSERIVLDFEWQSVFEIWQLEEKVEIWHSVFPETF